MNKINTVKKGDKLEIQIFNILKRLLDNEEFYLSGKRSKIYLKKDYYSALTKNKIIVDVAIETYLPNMDTYSILTVFECKNYETKIPVEKIRVFQTVLNEIGAHKGIIVSKLGFQKGVKDTAKVTNIGLCVLNKNEELNWINTRLLKKFIDDNIENEQTIIHYNTSDKVNKRMEIQANIFASLLLLPEIPLKRLVKQYFKKERIHKNHLYLDHQLCNRQLVYSLLSEIKNKFEVSHEAGKY